MDIIENGDVCSLIFLLILLTFVGRFFVQNSPRLETMGLRIVAGVGLLYALLNLSDENTATAGDIAGLVLRSIAAGGLVLGPSWIVLSVGSYIFGHLDR